MIRFEVGAAYYVETYGKNFVARVAAVTPTEVVLADAAWVADTGRFHEFLRDGRTESMEIEPLPDGWSIPLAYVSGTLPWPHPLFRDPV